MYEGVPPGGPLVPELLAAANASLGNDSDEAAIELPSGATLQAQGEIVVSVDGTPHRLADGATLDIVPDGDAVHYVALPGGIYVAPVLGSRSTLVVAGMGGLKGRFLSRGDVLYARHSSPPVTRVITPASFSPEDPVHITLGPDEFAAPVIDALLSTPFRVGPSDRVGMRLIGPRLPVQERDDAPSLPMVRGAIQVTRDGSAIVLGPDFPTTGGYRVIGVVVSRDLGALARRRAGATVHFKALRRSA
jgi:allophanate hydrolase subunit 2